MLQVSVVVSELQKAVQSSHRSHTEAFTRAAVALCLQRGLTVTDTAYMMDPVLLPEMDHDLLQSRSTQKYFSVVTGPPNCEPMVVAHIPSLISKPCKKSVQKILSRLQINMAYPTETKDVLRQITASSAASSSTNSNFPCTKASRSRSDGSSAQVSKYCYESLGRHAPMVALLSFVQPTALHCNPRCASDICLTGNRCRCFRGMQFVCRLCYCTLLVMSAGGSGDGQDSCASQAGEQHRHAGWNSGCGLRGLLSVPHWETLPSASKLANGLSINP